MKITLIIHEPSLSGANLGLLEALTSLKNEDIELSLISPSYGKLIKEIIDVFPRSKVIITPYRWWMSGKKKWSRLYPFRILLRNILVIWDLTKILKKSKPDLIWSNTITVNIGFYLSKILNIRHLWYIHEYGTLDHGLKYNFGSKIARIILRNSGEIVVNSKTTSEYFKSILNKEIPFLYYSMDLFQINQEVNVTNNLRSAIIYGRISESKGHLIIVNAFCKLIKKGKNIKLTILGSADDADLLNRIKKIINESNLNESINIINHTDNPIQIVNQHDVVINCSKNEAFGRVNIEAMKLGKILVASNNGSSPELIVNDFNGILFERSVDGLCNCLLDLLTRESSKLEEISNNARNYAFNNFSSEIQRKELLKFILDGK